MVLIWGVVQPSSVLFCGEAQNLDPAVNGLAVPANDLPKQIKNAGVDPASQAAAQANGAFERGSVSKLEDMSSKDLEFLNKWILEVSSLNPPRGKARTDKYNFNPGKLFRDDLAWKLGANYTVTVSDTSRRENFGSPFATDRYVFTITRRAQPEVVGNMLYSITFKGTGAKGRLSINPASIVIVYAIPNPDFISPVVASTPSPLFLCCV